MSRCGRASLQGWHEFFVAGDGVSEAPAGLVFVGVSINLTQTMRVPSLPSRALESLAALFTVLRAGNIAPRSRSDVHGHEMRTDGTPRCTWMKIAWVLVPALPLRNRRNHAIDRAATCPVCSVVIQR